MTDQWHVVEQEQDIYDAIGIFHSSVIANDFARRLRKALRRSTRPHKLGGDRVVSYHREACFTNADGSWRIITQCRLASQRKWRDTISVIRYQATHKAPQVRLRMPKGARS